MHKDDGDGANLKERVLLRLLTSPLTVAPAFLGLTAAMAGWGLEFYPLIAGFAGLAGVLASAGIFFSRLVMSGEDTAREVLLDDEKRLAREQQKELDVLKKKLMADGDPRTEQCLQDLRTMHEAFYTSESWRNQVAITARSEILSGVEKLFHGCIEELTRSRTLYDMIEQVSTEAARAPIIKQREQSVSEVVLSVGRLGEILARIQSIDVEQAQQTGDLAQIRDELDKNLEVAASVAQRMKELDRDLQGQKE